MKTIYFLIAAILLQGCASGFRTELDPETRTNLTNIELYNLIIQDEIRPAVKTANSSTSAGAAGGLIGMAIGGAIDSSINKKRSKTAQAIIEPLWAATADFNYRELSATVLNTSLAKEFKLSNQPNQAEAAMLSKAELVKRLNDLPEGAGLLYLSGYYSFVNDSKQMITQLIANLYEGSSTPLKSPSKPIYRNMFFHQSEVLGAGDDDSMLLWLEDDASKFESELKEGLSRTAELLSYDLVAHPEENCAQKAKIRVANVFLDTLQPISGQIITNENSLVQIRHSNGLLYSIEGPPETVQEAGSKTLAKCKPL